MWDNKVKFCQSVIGKMQIRWMCWLTHTCRADADWVCLHFFGRIFYVGEGESDEFCKVMLKGFSWNSVTQFECIMRLPSVLFCRLNEKWTREELWRAVGLVFEVMLYVVKQVQRIHYSLESGSKTHSHYVNWMSGLDFWYLIRHRMCYFLVSPLLNSLHTVWPFSAKEGCAINHIKFFNHFNHIHPL